MARIKTLAAGTLILPSLPFRMARLWAEMASLDAIRNATRALGQPDADVRSFEARLVGLSGRLTTPAA